MNTITGACGRQLDEPTDPRRFRCPGCPRIYDPRRLGWDPPQEGVATPGEIKSVGLDRPIALDSGAFRRIDWPSVQRFPAAGPAPIVRPR